MISHIIRTLPLRTKTSEISSIASVAMLEFRRTFAHSDTHILRLRRYAEKPCRFIPAALFVRAMTYEGVLGRRATHIFIRGPIIIGSSCIIFTPDFARGAHSIWCIGREIFFLLRKKLDISAHRHGNKDPQILLGDQGSVTPPANSSTLFPLLG